jgi:hypothetical protein
VLRDHGWRCFCDRPRLQRVGKDKLGASIEISVSGWHSCQCFNITAKSLVMLTTSCEKLRQINVRRCQNIKPNDCHIPNVTVTIWWFFLYWMLSQLTISKICRVRVANTAAWPIGTIVGDHKATQRVAITQVFETIFECKTVQPVAEGGMSSQFQSEYYQTIGGGSDGFFFHA